MGSALGCKGSKALAVETVTPPEEAPEDTPDEAWPSPNPETPQKPVSPTEKEAKQIEVVW